MAVKAGEAFVEILAVTTGLQKGLNRAKAQLKSFGTAVTRIGAQLTGLGVALTTPFVAGVKVFADFETSLAKIGTLLGDDISILDEFGKEVRNLSQEFGEPTGKIAEALFDIISASIPASKALDVLTASLKLTKAGFTDTQTSTRAVIRIMKSYGEAAGDAADISDFLFLTAKLGIVTFEELAQNIGNVAGVAGLAGFKMDEFGASLASITKLLGAEEAVTSLRNIILTFVKPADDAAKLAKKFGFELNTMTLRSEGLLGVLKKIKDLPLEVITRIFPEKRAIKGIAALVGNFEQFSKDIDKFASKAGTTDVAFKLVMKTLTVFGQRVKQVGADILRSLGAPLATGLKRVSDIFIGYLKIVNTIIKRNGSMVKTFAKVVLGVLAVGGVLVAVGVSITAFGIAIGAVSSIIGFFVTSILLIVSTISAILTPIGFVISIVVALGVAVVTNFGLIDKAVIIFTKTVKSLKDIFQQTFKGIVSAIKAGDLKSAFDILTAGLRLVWAGFIDELLKAWESFKSEFIRVSIDVFNGAVDAAIVGAQAIKKVWDNLVVSLALLFEQIKNKAADTFADLELVEVLNAVESKLEGIAGQRQVADVRQDIIDKFNKKRKEREEDFIKTQRNLIQGSSLIQKKGDAEIKKFLEKFKINPGEVDPGFVGPPAPTESEKSIQKAQRELALALQTAKQKRETETMETGSTIDGVQGAFDDIKNAIRDSENKFKNFDIESLISGVASPGRLNQLLGSFTGGELSGGMVSIANENLKANKESAKNTKDILTISERGGLAFS